MGRLKLFTALFGRNPTIGDHMSNVRSLIISGVKTAVQVGVAAFVAWLASLGIDVAGEAAQALETGLFMVMAGVVASLLNWAGDKWPLVNRFISLGISNQTATYTGTGGTQP